MKCICEDLPNKHGDMCGGIRYYSKDYNGFSLEENYGTWTLHFSKRVKFFKLIEDSVEIFYCPFCGKKLNHWPWAKQRCQENFEKYFEEE